MTPQEKAATLARDRCCRDQTPERFDQTYRDICDRRGTNADDPGTGRDEPTLRCPSCGRSHLLTEFELVEDAPQRMSEHIGYFARRSPQRHQEIAAKRAQAMCEGDASPEKFDSRYRAELGKL